MGRAKKHKPQKNFQKQAAQKQGPPGASATLPATLAMPTPEPIELQNLNAIVARAALGPLDPDDHRILMAAVSTLTFLTLEIEAKNASIKRLRQLLFGSSTEKSRKILPASDSDSDPAGAEGAAKDKDADSSALDPKSPGPKKKAKGHGRNPAAAYTGAKKICVSHDTLKAGELCPGCGKGKVYPVKPPKALVRITGLAPLGATVYELERLRCNLCGEMFTAPAPEGVGDAKYDETAASMCALLKYGTGVPFNRLEKLQRGLGIPLPSSTQWELVAEAADRLLPTYRELVHQAAQGEVLHNDDTAMKILMLMGERKRKAVAAGERDSSDRVGIYTSGIVAAGTQGKKMIALFFTGLRHAGENLTAVLAERAGDLEDPIQMCDALSHNTAGNINTNLAHCLTHARRRFADIVKRFPKECRFVIEALREVYGNDAKAKERGLSAEERLAFHQANSRRKMVGLKRWLRQQLREHKTEPNSCLGQAIAYMLKHWEPLTLFLRAPGAPLDNNICERALKKAILHRKNAYFYMSENGARVGDLFMSLIHTAELNEASPFQYLNALQLHHDAAAKQPADWMPWNYTVALEKTRAAGRSA